ncbi:hypothetical protein [Actinomadura rubrisoli]|uniref:DUF485 domain-containing protein n=1 Tax=Actinomadura rubrisoli TaxID=2530368 RepID=A0A4R5B8L4_9ACTN|nr:hypothetical protein [Actinomadura rubrisoli]TDD82628.1 hypothetical protein E1298_22440 [Actinomadura rubrisoli]
MTHPHEHRESTPDLKESSHENDGFAEHDAAIRQHKRVVLGAAGVTVAAFMTFPVLASFTGVFDGVANGVGAGYVAGLVVILLPVIGAVVYRAWTSRMEGGER